VSEAQHDYAPAISPDGTRVAYVRHTQRTDTRISLAPLPARCEIRTINYDGTGDRTVLPIAEGLWVSQLAWAPDGTAIAFDLAPQLVISGIPAASGDVTRSEIYTVPSDGSTPQRAVASPASFPAWAPGQLPTANPNVSLRMNRAADGGLRLRAVGDQMATPLQLERSLDLVHWTSMGTLSPGAEFAIEPAEGAFMFFRVRF
jgi:hypothetical protein